MKPDEWDLFMFFIIFIMVFMTVSYYYHCDLEEKFAIDNNSDIIETCKK